MKVAVDTDIFACASGVNGLEKALPARRLIENLQPEDTVVPVQVLGELFSVLVRKGKVPRAKARSMIAELSASFQTADTTFPRFEAALDLSERHGLNVFDAIILSVSASAGCRLLLSEDMQHGFEWRGVTVVNPFLPEPHPLLRHAFGA